MAIDLTNKPTPGGDEGQWGQELNDALDELDTKKASAAEVYSKTVADARFVRTVNGTGPDGSGNVTVSGGTGGTGGAVDSVNGKVGAVTLTATDVGARPVGVNIPVAQVSGLSGVALSGRYTDLEPTTIPAPAVALTQKGAPNGVATLDSTQKVPVSQMPPGFGGSTLMIFQNVDGSWPSRTTVTTDRTSVVFWQGKLPGPPIGTAVNTAVAAKDKLIVVGPVA